MYDGCECDYASEEVGVLNEGYGKLDQLRDVLRCLDGLCGVDIVGWSWHDRLVRSTGGDIPGNA